MDINTGIVVGAVITVLVVFGLKFRGRGLVLEITVDGDGYRILIPLFLIFLVFIVIGLVVTTILR